MSHELNKEDLSAFMDGELPPARQAELVVHLGACAECAGYIERLKKGKAAFKAHGLEEAPAAVMAAAPKRGSRVLFLVPALAIIFALTLVTGMALKRFMPGLFSQIQGMISGAAADLSK